jgi:DNA invertase Pin-like site-specific DNA recombinase
MVQPTLPPCNAVFEPVPMRAAIYARVSTFDQNPDMQVQHLREYAKVRGFEVVKEYVDQVTGNMEKRRRERSRKDVAYQELMVDAHLGRFEVVLVWKFDRFARSLSGLIEALQIFSALGIDFISSTQAVDTTTPMGRLFFHMVGAFAEFERELIVERVKAGLANARQRGITLGRPIDPSLERRIAELRHSGSSLRQIAKEVGRSPAGVKRVLDRLKNVHVTETKGESDA